MKTAVEWLQEQYDYCPRYEEQIHDEDWEEAKAMEKEKAVEFAKYCLDKAKDLDIRTAFMNVEEYYKTFKQQEQ